MQTERREIIRQLLTQSGSLRVEELAGRLEVTPMTIRRDLSALEGEGVLVRTHGGCVIQSPMVRELSFSEKDQQCAAEKAAIAREAASRIPAGSSLYLDTGTTALHVARALPEGAEFRVFTNNLRIAMELHGHAGVEVIVYGGRLAPRSPDLVGDLAVAQAANFRVDLAVVGADALDPRRGEMYSADMETCHLARAVRGQAGRVLVVLDSSKIGKRALVVTGRLGEGVTLVTDDGAREEDRRALRATGAEVVVASVGARVISAGASV